MTSKRFELTEQERALLPTDEQVRFYAEHGWYLTEKLLSDEEVDTLAEAAEAFYAGKRDRRLPLLPPKLAYWRPSDGDVQRHNDYICYEVDEIARILAKPIIGAVAARLAETDQIRIWQSTLIYKPSRPEDRSNVVPWHFDRHYWQTCISERMLTAFIPFHDCAEEMGTITMVDGSHRWAEIGARDSSALHFADRDPAELDQMLAENARYNGTTIKHVPMVIKKGHMSFHHCKIYHGSGPNRSGRPRKAISFHLQDRDNRYREFRTSDGEVVEYNHDTLVRRTLEGHPEYSDSRYCPVLWESGG